MVSAIGLRAQNHGTHSLRRTKASIIYKQTGNLRAVQILLGHAKIESTVAISALTSRTLSNSPKQLRSECWRRRLRGGAMLEPGPQ